MRSPTDCSLIDADNELDILFTHDIVIPNSKHEQSNSSGTRELEKVSSIRTLALGLPDVNYPMLSKISIRIIDLDAVLSISTVGPVSLDTGSFTELGYNRK